MHFHGLTRRRTATWPPYRVWLLLGAIWLAVVAGLGYANVMVIDRYAASSNQQIEQRTSLLAQMQMTLVGNQLDAIDRGLQVIRQRHVDRPVARLGPVLDFNPLVRDVWWVGPQGERLSSRHGTVGGIDPEPHGFFRQHRGPSSPDAAFLSPLLHPVGAAGAGLLAMSRAHRASDGRLLGVLVAWIDPAGLARVLGKMTLNDRLTCLVAHPDGDVLVTAPHVKIDPGTTLEYLQSGGQELPATGSGRYRSAIDGKQYHYAYAALDDWELLVFAAEDRTPLTPCWRSMRVIIGLAWQQSRYLAVCCSCWSAGCWNAARRHCAKSRKASGNWRKATDATPPSSRLYPTCCSLWMPMVAFSISSPARTFRC